MPDPLYAQAKQLFPNASDEEIEQGLAQVREQAPAASDQELLASAGKIQASMNDGSFMKQMVNHDIKQKYGLADRQKIVDQNAQEASGPNWQAGLAALGAGLQGGNALQAGMSVAKQQEDTRKGRLAEFDKQKSQYLSDRDDAAAQEKLKREMDPNSDESKMAQSLAVAMGMSAAQAKSLTASKFKEFSPALQKKYEIAEKSLDRKERSADRMESREIRQSEKQLAREDKQSKESKLSDKQIESFTDIDNAASDLNNILAGLGKNSNWTGPIDGRTPDILVGEDQAAWRSAIGKYKDAYRKAITGAGASAQEMARLETRLPSENDTFENFKAKAAEAQKELARRRETLASNLEKGGKNVANFKPEHSMTQNYDKDVLNYAQKHGISPDEAQKIKMQRTGQTAVARK